MVELNASEKRVLVEALHSEYSVRRICQKLGFNRSSLYYQPKGDMSDDVLRNQVQRLAGRYPKYGYRRINKLLVRLGYTVGYNLSQPLTLKPLEQALRQSVPEIHHSDQGVQYLSWTYISTLMRHDIEIP